MGKIKNVKKLDVKIPLIIMLTLAVVFFALGGLYAFFGDGSYKAEKSEVLRVSDIKSIVERDKFIVNDTVVLTNDIHVTDSAFTVGGKDCSFAGVFEGHGHTVYLDYGSGDASTSFFASISEKGIVKNTRFVFTSVRVNGSAFSGVAKINYGTVADCAVEYNIEISAKDGMFTPFVSVNRGTVRNIVSSGTLVLTPSTEQETPDEGENPETPEPPSEEEQPETPDENEPSVTPDENEPTSDPDLSETVRVKDVLRESEHASQKNEDEKKISFGSVCVYNYGMLKNVLSTPEFDGFYCTNRDNYLSGRSENVSIASVCAYTVHGEYDGKKATESGLVSICEKTLYTSDDLRVVKYENFAAIVHDTNGAFTKTVIENTYDFNNTVWEIDETEFKLKLNVK